MPARRMVILAVLMVIFSTFLVGILPIFLGVLLILSAASSLGQVISYGRIAGKQNILLI